IRAAIWSQNQLTPRLSEPLSLDHGDLSPIVRYAVSHTQYSAARSAKETPHQPERPSAPVQDVKPAPPEFSRFLQLVGQSQLQCVVKLIFHTRRVPQKSQIHSLECKNSDHSKHKWVRSCSYTYVKCCSIESLRRQVLNLCCNLLQKISGAGRENFVILSVFGKQVHEVAFNNAVPFNSEAVDKAEDVLDHLRAKPTIIVQSPTGLLPERIYGAENLFLLIGKSRRADKRIQSIELWKLLEGDNLAKPCGPDR